MSRHSDRESCLNVAQISMNIIANTRAKDIAYPVPAYLTGTFVSTNSGAFSILMSTDLT